MPDFYASIKFTIFFFFFYFPEISTDWNGVLELATIPCTNSGHITPTLERPSHVLQLKNNYLQSIAIPNMELFGIKEQTIQQTLNSKSPKIHRQILQKSQWFGIFTQGLILVFWGEGEKLRKKLNIPKPRPPEYWIKGLLL